MPLTKQHISDFRDEAAKEIPDEEIAERILDEAYPGMPVQDQFKQFIHDLCEMVLRGEV